MNILYIISTIRTIDGNGGHYYSFKSTVTALQNHHSCVIVNLGRFESPVVNSIDLKTHNIVYTKFRPIKILKNLIEIVRSESPDVIHCFDIHAYLFGNIIAHMFKIPIILTKCGGPNTIKPINFFPWAKNIIVYSRENKQYFEDNKKYRRSNIHFIPNRINTVEQDYELISKIKATFEPDARIFLRISRISEYYKFNLFQSYNLIKNLNADGHKVRLLIIGLIQDQKVYEELCSKTDDSVLILTNTEYTVNASRLIDVADFVIGTGRSFMEASSREKVLLCPIKNSPFPLLITKNNITEAFDTNFSDRIAIENFDSEENYSAIIKALIEQRYYKELSSDMKEISNDYFELETVIEKYSSLYRNVAWTNEINIPDMAIQFAMLIWFSKK